MAAVPILTYHNIGDPPAGAALSEMYVPARVFRRQLRWLRVLGYRGVTVTEACRYLRSDRRARVVALTFDDGYGDTFDAALPVLREYNFTATCYVVSARIGEHNTWDDHLPNMRQPLMTADQLRAWCAHGMEIGAHTRTHVRLSDCSATALEDEIRGSKLELESMLSCTITQFCYPYGDTGGAAAAACVREAGFVAATTTRRGRATVRDDPWLLPRIPVKGHKPAHLLPLRVLTAYEDGRQ